MPPSQTRRHERYVERARDRDEPTRVKTIRKRYAQALRGRWKAIRSALREGLAENDALGVEALVDAPSRGQFDFDRAAKQERAFTRWLDRQTEREILKQFGEDNQYVTTAYEKGVEDAQTELRALGLAGEGEAAVSATQLPAHRDQLQALYARNFNELEGMTDAVATDLRRTLTEGLASGDGPRDIARDLTDVIGQVEDGTPRGAMNRATTIARTEVMNSHNHARLQEWERAGVEQVDVLIADDGCPQCQAYAAGAPYPASEAYGNLPRHPNCRCSHVVHTD